MFWPARFILLLILLSGSAAAGAAEPRPTGGQWDAWVDSAPFKLSIGEEGYNHPHDFMAVCTTRPARPGETVPVAEIMLDPNEQLVSEAVATGSYLVARFEAGGSHVDLEADSIEVNEGPSFSFWMPQFVVRQPEKLIPILLGDEVVLHFGVRPGTASTMSVRESYRLPNENRIESVDFFAQACFPGWDKPKPAR